MSGLWLRQAADTQRHVCFPPMEAGEPLGQIYDIWQCDCRRRWIIKPADEPSAGYVYAEWRPRRLPWPRPLQPERA